MNFCTFRRLIFTKLTKFSAPKMAVLELIHSAKLISRKIWITAKSWNFHTVPLYSYFRSGETFPACCSYQNVHFSNWTPCTFHQEVLPLFSNFVTQIRRSDNFIRWYWPVPLCVWHNNRIRGMKHLGIYWHTLNITMKMSLKGLQCWHQFMVNLWCNKISFLMEYP